jgi:hypothetical protein
MRRCCGAFIIVSRSANRCMFLKTPLKMAYRSLHPVFSLKMDSSKKTKSLSSKLLISYKKASRKASLCVIDIRWSSFRFQPHLFPVQASILFLLSPPAESEQVLKHGILVRQRHRFPTSSRIPLWLPYRPIGQEMSFYIPHYMRRYTKRLCDGFGGPTENLIVLEL